MLRCVIFSLYFCVTLPAFSHRKTNFNFSLSLIIYIIWRAERKTLKKKSWKCDSSIIICQWGHLCWRGYRFSLLHSSKLYFHKFIISIFPPWSYRPYRVICFTIPHPWFISHPSLYKRDCRRWKKTNFLRTFHRGAAILSETYIYG